jgi:hypothetical protein
MRLLAVVLFMMAAAKIALVHHLHQAAARDVVVAAYATEAIAACEKAEPAFKLAATPSADVEMVVGDRGRSVGLWQVDHADWAMRYRQVYLIVKRADAACTFDVQKRIASIWGKKS